MLQLKNSTPFAVSVALFPNAAGVDTLYTMVKATFRIGGQWTLAEHQPKPHQKDVYWDEPHNSSLRYASDHHIGKPSTDIFMSGSACGPQQQTMRQLDVQLKVGRIEKTVRVFGDRFWRGGHMTPPEPFVTMPLVYENAFGGVEVAGDAIRATEDRNPVGVGFVGKMKDHQLEGKPLPNLECPSSLIRVPGDAPTPACFAPVAGHWLPRRAYAGTYDEAWQSSRAPYLPEDYSPRFMNSAHPDLIYPGYIEGGEPVRIAGMHPDGVLEFNVPHVKLVCKVAFAKGEVVSEFVLETLDLDPNHRQLSLVWRSATECDKQIPAIKHIAVSMTR